jgi:hypothetical protein
MSILTSLLGENHAIFGRFSPGENNQPATPDNLTDLVCAPIVVLMKNANLMWQDAAKTTLATADGDPVYVFQCTFSGIEWTAPNSGSCAILTDEGSGKWSLEHTSDYYQATTFSCGSNCSIYFRVIPNDSNMVALFDSAPGNGNVIRNFPDAFGGTPNWEWHPHNPDVSMTLPSGTDATIAFLHSTALTNRTVHHRKDGAFVSETAGSGTSDAAWVTPCIGTVNQGGNGFYNGRWLGAIFCNSTHDTTTSDELAAYLAAISEAPPALTQVGPSGGDTTWNVYIGPVGPSGGDTTWNVAAPSLGVRSSQDIISILLNENPNGRVTQNLVNVLYNESPAVRNTQSVVLALIKASLAHVGPSGGDTTWNVRITRGDTRDTTWEVVGHSVKGASTTWNTKTTLPRYDSLSLWLKADQGVTLDGLDHITDWVNYASPRYSKWVTAGNHDAVQTSTFARPALTSGALNGLPVATFDGIRNFLSINNSVGLIDDGRWGADIFVVMKDARSGDGFDRFIIANSVVTSIDTSWFFGTTNNAPTGFLYTAYYGGNQDTTYHNTGRGDPQVGNYILATAELTVNNTQFPTVYVNQTDQGASTNTLGGFDWTQEFYVGRHGDLDEGYWLGDIAEIIVYGDTSDLDIFGRTINNTLNLAEKTQVEDYLKLKWFGLVSVGTSSDTTWNVEHLPFVSKTADTTWNSLHSPFLNVPTLWNVYQDEPTQVNRSRSVIWNVNAHVTKDPVSTTWDVAERLHVGPDGGDTTWNVAERGHVGPDGGDTTWNVRHRVVVSGISTRWNIKHVRSKFRTVYFNDRVVIAPSSPDASWNVVAPVAKTCDTTWDVYSVAGRLMNPQPANRTRWNVYRDSDTAVNQQIYSEWNSDVNVASNRQGIWNTEANIAKSAVVTWYTKVLVTRNRATTWNTHKSARIVANTAWSVFPNAKYGFPLWNVLVLAKKTSVAKWVTISYNNNVADTSWNIRFLVGTNADTSWGVRPPPIHITNTTTWDIGGRVKVGIDTTWEARRVRRKLAATYWEVIYGVVYCVSPPPTEPIFVAKHVRWKVIGSISPRIFGNTLWKVRKPVGAARTPSWRVRQLVGTNVEDQWVVGAFTISVNLATTWNVFKKLQRVSATDWNVRIGPTGPNGGDTSWNVRKLSDNPLRQAIWNVSVRLLRAAIWNTKISSEAAVSDTSWNTRQLVSIPDGVPGNPFSNSFDGSFGVEEVTWQVLTNVNVSTSTVWAIALKLQRVADWDTKKVVGVSVGTTFTTKLKVDQTSIADWKSRKVSNKTAATSWDYSVVNKSNTTPWNVKHVIANEDRGGTLWNVHPPCSAAFVLSDPCQVNNQSNCGSTALLPRITVCELTQDSKTKKYKSKYVKKYL